MQDHQLIDHFQLDVVKLMRCIGKTNSLHHRVMFDHCPIEPRVPTTSMLLRAGELSLLVIPSSVVANRIVLRELRLLSLVNGLLLAD